MSKGTSSDDSGPSDAVDAAIGSINSSVEMLLRLHSSRRVVEIQSELVNRRVSQPGLALLRRLIAQGPMPIGELARAARMDNGAAARQVASLEADGNVVREPSAADGRLWVIHITADGEDLVTRASALERQHMRDALNGWSDRELTTLSRSLDRFVNALRLTDFKPLSGSADLAASTQQAD